MILKYSLTGSHSDAIARSYVTANTPIEFAGLYRQNIAIKPKGNGYWDVEIPYGPLPYPEKNEFVLSFDTTGGTGHITQAKKHIGSYAVEGDQDDINPHNGAINVTDNGVEGTDIVISQFSWREEWELPISYASFTYGLVLKGLTGKVNNADFRGFDTGSVRFDGASGSISNKDPELAHLTYGFTQSDNSTNAVPDVKLNVAKKGFEYLWLEYHRVENAAIKALVTPPKAIHVERVYDLGDFSTLDIGTTIVGIVPPG